MHFNTSLPENDAFWAFLSSKIKQSLENLDAPLSYIHTISWNPVMKHDKKIIAKSFFCTEGDWKDQTEYETVIHLGKYAFKVSQNVANTAISKCFPEKDWVKVDHEEKKVEVWLR